MSDIILVLLKGFVLGLSIAIPLGPISVLIFSRSLKFGFLAGITSAAGASLADAFYAAVAAFGLTLISDFLVDMQNPIRVVGALFLLGLGIQTFRKKTIATGKAGARVTHLRGFGVTFLLTLTSPMTILLFATLFASLGLAEIEAGRSVAGYLVVGTFLGTFSWMGVLCILSHIMRTRVTENILGHLNRFAGLILLAFALYLGALVFL